MTKCQYCGEDMKLKRFIKEDFEGQYEAERFVFCCETCKIVISPSLVMLVAQGESEKELQRLREIYFAQQRQEATQIKQLKQEPPKIK